MAQSFDSYFLSYAAYHRNPFNKLSHFFGVPLATLGLLAFFSLFRFGFDSLFPGAQYLSVGTIFYGCVVIWFLRINFAIGLFAALVNLPLIVVAEWSAQQSAGFSLSLMLGANILGWAIQLVGHVFEGKRPALVDNILQIFNAPMFLAAEVFFVFGWRPDLKSQAAASSISIT